MSLLVDQRVPEGTCNQVLRSTSVNSWRFEIIEIFVSKLIEIVILWVYYTIPFGFSLFLALLGRHFPSFETTPFWLRITEEGLVPEKRIWSILFIKSDLKWCIHHSSNLFIFAIKYLTSQAKLSYTMKTPPLIRLCTELDLLPNFEWIP